MQKALNASQVPGTSELGKPAFEEHFVKPYEPEHLLGARLQVRLLIYHISLSPHNHPGIRDEKKCCLEKLNDIPK